MRQHLGRGLLRLGFACVALWFVFWTFAYVLHPQTSHSPPPGSPLALAAHWHVFVPCLIAALPFAAWAAAAFRIRKGEFRAGP